MLYRPRLISICVSYHSDSDLPSLVESLCADKGFVHEIVIVDNAVSNETQDLVEHLDSLYGEATVRYIPAPGNRGYATALNIGLREVGEHHRVLIVNPDIRIPSGVLTQLSLHLDDGVDAVAPTLTDEMGVPVAWEQRLPTLSSTIVVGLHLHIRLSELSKHGGRFGREASGHVEWLSGACIMIAGSRLGALPSWCEDYFLYMEDVDWSRKLAEVGGRVAVTPGAKVVHIGGTSTDRIPARRYVQRRIAKLIYAKRWWRGWQFSVVWSFFLLESLAKFLAAALFRRDSKGQRIYLLLAPRLVSIRLLREAQFDSWVDR